jgi:hypothetical protein
MINCEMPSTGLWGVHLDGIAGLLNWEGFKEFEKKFGVRMKSQFFFAMVLYILCSILLYSIYIEAANATIVHEACPKWAKVPSLNDQMVSCMGSSPVRNGRPGSLSDRNYYSIHRSPCICQAKASG